MLIFDIWLSSQENQPERLLLRLADNDAAVTREVLFSSTGIRRRGGSFLDLGAVFAQAAQGDGKFIRIPHTVGTMGDITFSSPTKVVHAALRHATDIVLAEAVGAVGRCARDGGLEAYRALICGGKI